MLSSASPATNPVAPYGTVYLTQWFERSLVYIRPTLLITIALVLLFYPIDSIVLPPDAASFLQSARVMFMVPMLGLVYLLTYTRIDAGIYFLVISLLYLAGGILFIAAMQLGGPDATLYGLVALMQTLTFLFIPNRIPSFFCIPTGLIILFIAGYTIWSEPDIALSVKWMFTGGLGTALILFSASVIVRDLNARDFFESVAASERTAQDQDLWAEMITRVLKHELGNQLTGLSSSMEMMKLFSNQTNTEPVPASVTEGLHPDRIQTDIDAAIESNLSTVNELRQLLTRTSQYLSVNLASAQQADFKLGLHEVVSDASFNFKSRHPLVNVSVQNTSTGVSIWGNGRIMTIALESLLEFILARMDHKRSEPMSLNIGLADINRIRITWEPSWRREPGQANTDINNSSSHSFSQDFTYLIAQHIIFLHRGKLTVGSNPILQKTMIEVTFEH